MDTIIIGGMGGDMDKIFFVIYISGIKSAQYKMRALMMSLCLI